MFNRFWFVPLLLGSLMAFTLPSADYSNLVAQFASQATPARQPSTSTAPDKTTTIQVGGKPQTIPLEFVETSRFSIYFPTDRFKRAGDDDISDIKLRWKKSDGTFDDNNFIAFKFFDKDTKLSEVRDFANAEAGLRELRGARRLRQSPAIAEAKRTYSPWLRDVIRVENSLPNDPSKSGSVTVYLGEVNGQVFAVFSARRFENEDEFTAREAAILKNLKFKNEMK